MAPLAVSSFTLPSGTRNTVLLLAAGALGGSVVAALARRVGLGRRRRPAPPAAGKVDESRSTTSSAGGGTAAYETRKAVDEYLQFHYGRPEDILPYDVGPKEALNFPARLAELAERHCEALRDFTGERRAPAALDVGCAVGGATFELARSFKHVLGIDYSQTFVAAAQTMKERGWMRYSAVDEGEITSEHAAAVPEDIERERVAFQQGDACNLPPTLRAFDAVLVANLLCRLPDPSAFLDRLPKLVAPGGVLVLVSPYSWLPAWTPKDKWLGGYLDKNGEPVWSSDTLRQRLSKHFELVEEAEVPFLIREHRRKFQWGCSQALVWRRKA